MTGVDLWIRRDGGDREDIPLHYGPVRVDPDGTVSRILAQPAFPLDAEQLVRLAGFALNLWHVRTQRPGETIPSAEQLTLDLAAAVGVTLPTRQGRVAILANGTKMQTKLLPYGATSIPAALDQEGC